MPGSWFKYPMYVGRRTQSPRKLVESALAYLDGPDGATITPPMFGPKDVVSRGDLNLWLQTWVVPALEEAHKKLSAKEGA